MKYEIEPFHSDLSLQFFEDIDGDRKNEPLDADIRAIYAAEPPDIEASHQELRWIDGEPSEPFKTCDKDLNRPFA